MSRSRGTSCATSSAPPASPRPPPLRRAGRRKKIGEFRRTRQINYVLGHLSIDRSQPDYFPLLVLEHLFCRSTGFSDRLSRVIRDENGRASETWGGLASQAGRVPG